MNKVFLFFLILLSTATAVAQKVITFKSVYKPKMSYIQNIKQTSKTEVSYNGSAEMLQTLEQQGITNPTLTDNVTVINCTTTTGKLINDEVPFKMKVKFDSGTGANEIIDNTVVYGRAKQNGMPVFDSVQAPGMDAFLKDIYFKSLYSRISQYIIPERKVEVGESFTTTILSSIPTGAETLSVTDIATYKLVKVEGIKAFFDVNHTYTIDCEVSGKKIQGRGHGVEKTVHDYTNNFLLQQNLNMFLEIGFDNDGVAMLVKSNSDIVTDCIISVSK